MRITGIILVFIGIALTAFGAWGRFSEAGRQKFDEMAGMIPYFAYWFGIAFAVIAVALLVIDFIRK